MNNNMIEIDNILYSKERIIIKTDINLNDSYETLTIKVYPTFFLISNAIIEKIDDSKYKITGDIHGAYSKYEYEKSDFYEG